MSKRILVLLILSSLKEYKSTLLRGKRVHDGQFPWLIQFQTIAPCGGVLLSPDWVLTAAQCVQDKRNSIVLFAAGLNGTGSRQAIYVKATYIFPRYEAYSEHYDRDHNIALLKLTHPFDMCDAKVILPEVASVRLDDNYKSCLIFGWQSYVSPSSKVLAKPIQYSEVILNSWKLCAYMIKGNANYTNVFCTMVEFKDDMKACAGNPGSPIVCKNRYQKIVLLGIASWTNFSLNCGDLPTYLDISAFRAWMYDLIFNDKNTKGQESGNQHNKRFCKAGQYLEQTDIESNARNYTDSAYTSTGAEYSLDNKGTKSEPHLQKDPNESSNTSYVRNNVFPSILNSEDYTKVSSSPEYYNVPYVDVVREEGDILQLYQEIGKNKTSLNTEDEIMESSEDHERLNYLDRMSGNKNTRLEKSLMEYAEGEMDDIDEFELIFPLNSDDASKSNPTVITYPKKLILFNLIYLCYFYRIFY